jgi:hypothetical protein
MLSLRAIIRSKKQTRHDIQRTLKNTWATILVVCRPLPPNLLIPIDKAF